MAVLARPWRAIVSDLQLGDEMLVVRCLERCGLLESRKFLPVSLRSRVGHTPYAHTQLNCLHNILGYIKIVWLL